jgi:hypothetical protein
MSTATLQAALQSELSRILEEAAFMLVEDSEAPLPDPVPAVEASLHFSGKHAGTCWLAVSEEGANHLAREMLGDELASDPNNCEHATAELLNILTAWVLDTWWGHEVEHAMGTPSATRRRFDETVAWALPLDQRVVVSTDAGYTFICGVTLED